MTIITLIGAGSTVFTKNLTGDILQRPALHNITLRLMDIDPQRLDDSMVVVTKIARTLNSQARIESYTDQRQALDGADFVICCFQIGGYDPCTIIDFDIPKKFGLRQTIADTLGVGGIMRGLRTVPHLWRICEDMTALCPDATLLQYVNPMAINTWAIGAKYPHIKQVGLCHSVQGTIEEIAQDLAISPQDIRYLSAGINHMSYYLKLEQKVTGGYRDLYPILREAYQKGTVPNPLKSRTRCPNKVRYEMMLHLGYFVTESSEHFAEYVPYFIKRDRPDLIERFGIPLDEYPKRCIENIEKWDEQAQQYRDAKTITVKPSHEYASSIIHSIVTNTPSVIYGNIPNQGYIPQLPHHAAVEVPILVDANGLHPTTVNAIPPQLIALMRSNINVQELTVAALLHEKPEHIYHAAMMDPHTAAELDLDQIRTLMDALRSAHGDWLPKWARLAP